METTMNCQACRRFLFVVTFCLFLVGCEKPGNKAKPDPATISYEVTFFHREMSPSGPALIEGPTASPKAATVSSVTDIGNFGLKATVQVQSIEQGKVTFKITLPHDKSQEAEMREGESKEFFENGGGAGIRIQVHQISS
jgi:hypothetical protein